MLTFRRRIAILALAIASSLVFVTSGKAQVVCYGPQDQLPAQTVADFVANPAQLLQQFPNGGPDFIPKIRDYVASGPATLPLILNLAGPSNPTQIDAIGTGLGQAALVCVRTDQAYANEIQQAVAAINNDALMLAFAAVFGDKPIGAEAEAEAEVAAGRPAHCSEPLVDLAVHRLPSVIPGPPIASRICSPFRAVLASAPAASRTPLQQRA